MSPISDVSSRVDVHQTRTELNSTTLSVGNRVCFNHNGYDPKACDVCSTNRDKKVGGRLETSSQNSPEK